MPEISLAMEVGLLEKSDSSFEINQHYLGGLILLVSSAIAGIAWDYFGSQATFWHPQNGPVAVLFRSFNRVLFAKGERQWERNTQPNSDRRRCVLH